MTTGRAGKRQGGAGRRALRLGLLALPPLMAALLSSARADDLLAVAEQLAKLDLRYAYGANDPAQGGLDCSAFTRIVFRQARGAELPDQADRQFEYCRRHGQVWDARSDWTPATLRPGDLIFYAGPERNGRVSMISHVMIYCGEGIMAGAQGRGRRLDGIEGGVGYYRFHIRRPKGVIGESGERFLGRRSLFAYGRLPGPDLPAPSLLAARAARSGSAATPLASLARPGRGHPRA